MWGGGVRVIVISVCIHWPSLSFPLTSFSYIPLQARNIAICIEFKDSDEEDSQPLKVCFSNN